MELDCFQILSPPFDVAQISAKRKQIKRLLLSPAATIPLGVAVVGGSTTSELMNFLDLFLLREGFQPVIQKSEYGRFFEHIRQPPTPSTGRCGVPLEAGRSNMQPIFGKQ
jgi:hypothetical protein